VTEPPLPDYGPQGYLPERASKRARKIVLRAPLGLQWIVAAVVFGVLVLVAGALWWQSTSGPPGPPFIATDVVLEAGQPPMVTATTDGLWIVTGTGPPFAVAPGQVESLAWCPASRRLESQDGRVWSPTGRGLGTPSLDRVPVRVHDGRVYVDPTSRLDGPRPSDDTATPAC
jgi:hypothetical protein